MRVKLLKILALHGKGSNPAKIKWLTEPLKEFGQVDAPNVEMEADEFLNEFLNKEYDLVAGHSRGGTYALLYAANKGVPVIAVSAPSDRILQLNYLSSFKQGTFQKNAYEDLKNLSYEYLKRTSPIAYADRIKKALLIHGTKDETVPLEQSKKMCEAILKSGGSCNLHELEMKHTPPASLYRTVNKIIKDWVIKNVEL